MSAIAPGDKKRFIAASRPGSAVDNPGIPENLQTHRNCVIVEISVSARNLRRADFLSQSDPVCILSEQEKGQEWKEVEFSEVIMNNCDPQFVKKFYVSKCTEKTKQLKFQLYDVDDHENKPYITEGNFLGQYECSLQRLVSNLNVEGQLKSQKDKPQQGEIAVVCEVESISKKQKGSLRFTLKLTNVKGSKHYVRISKNNDGRFIPFHRTETQGSHHGSPEWDLSIDLMAACNYDDKRRILFECFEDKNGSDKCVGGFYIPMERLKRSRETDKLELSVQRKGDKPIIACIKNILASSNQTFKDCVENGLCIKVTLALDFTTSNKKYHKRVTGDRQGSTEETTSLYGQAMTLILDKLWENYPKNVKVYACGLGAMEPGKDRVTEVLPLHNKTISEEYSSRQEVIDQYHQTLERITLSGPTHFAPPISYVCRKAEKDRKDIQEEYHILMIFTDGGIDDTARTKDAIARASKLPVSIVIIGIGDNDFDAMRMLDSDQKVLRCRNTGFAIRDIVQFVEFQKYDPCLAGGRPTGDDLIDEILQEIPGQFKSHAKGEEDELNMGSLRM